MDWSMVFKRLFLIIKKSTKNSLVNIIRDRNMEKECIKWVMVQFRKYNMTWEKEFKSKLLPNDFITFNSLSLYKGSSYLCVNNFK